MSARTLLNLALVALALLLAAVVWLRPGIEPEQAPATLATLQPADVSSINITRLQAAPLGFRRLDGAWIIGEQPAIPADDFQLRSILGLLEARSVRSYPADAIDLAGLGLDPPQASVMFDGSRFSIGSVEPLDGLRYILADATIHLVEDRYQHLLNAGFNNFVQRRLLPADARIRALRLPGLALVQRDGVNWQLEPADPDVGADAIDALVSNWQRASALFIGRYEAGEYAETISLTLQDASAPVVFAIVARQPDLVLARPEWGIQYHLTEDAAQRLLGLPEPAAPAP